MTREIDGDDDAAPSESDRARALSRRLGLEIAPDLLLCALTHPSYSNERPDQPDNQRLEFLGDAVLGLCVSELLMEEFDSVDEGQLTVMRASLVNAGALARVARELDIATALRLGRGASAGDERRGDNVLADAMEAVIGAVYLDRGLGACRELSRRLLGEDLARLLAAGGIQRDAKSRLQEIVQARGAQPPSYEVVAIEGPPHSRHFDVRVRVELQEVVIVGEGSGRSKKLAEQAAAQAALIEIEP